MPTNLLIFNALFAPTTLFLLPILIPSSRSGDDCRLKVEGDRDRRAADQSTGVPTPADQGGSTPKTLPVC